MIRIFCKGQKIKQNKVAQLTKWRPLLSNSPTYILFPVPGRRAECEGHSAAAPLSRAGAGHAAQEARQLDVISFILNFVTSGRILTRMVGLTVWASMFLALESSGHQDQNLKESCLNVMLNRSGSSYSNILDPGPGAVSPHSYLNTFSRYQLDGYCLAILFSSKVHIYSF